MLVGVGSPAATASAQILIDVDQVAETALPTLLQWSVSGRLLTDYRFGVLPVVEFDDTTVTTCGIYLRQQLTDAFVNLPTRTERTTPFAPERMDQVYQQFCLGVDSQSGQSVPELELPDYLLYGRLQDMGPEHVELFLGAISTFSGTYDGTVRVLIRKNEKYWYCYGQSSAVSRREVLIGSALVPGLGQLRTDRTRGWAYIGTAAAAIGGAVTLAILASNATADAQDASLRGAFDERDLYQSRSRAMSVGVGASLGLLGAAYVANLIDAGTMELDASTAAQRAPAMVGLESFKPINDCNLARQVQSTISDRTRN